MTGAGKLRMCRLNNILSRAGMQHIAREALMHGYPDLHFELSGAGALLQGSTSGTQCQNKVPSFVRQIGGDLCRNVLKHNR